MTFFKSLVPVLALAVSNLALAQQTYPSKPVTVIVPFAAGAGVDAFARAVSQNMAEQTHQPFVIENKTGAGGVIGAAYVAAQPADGYTLLATTDTSVYLTPHVVKTKLDPLNGLIPIGIAAASPAVIVVHPSLPVHNIKELIDYAKKETDPLSYATPGAGSLNHLAGERLAIATGVKFVHISYRGAAPALSDLIAGHVKMGIMILSSAIPSIESGKLRALAVVEQTRSKFRPDIPTVAESGVPNFALPVTGLGFWAPAGTPREIIAQLNTQIQKATRDPNIKANLEKAGVEIQNQSVAASIAMGKERFNTYQKLVVETKLSAD
jgi:tripartite-type tricarboxylate transporter receptor subunit TctC